MSPYLARGAEGALGAGAADQDGDGLVVGAGREGGVVEGVVVALEVDAVCAGVKQGAKQAAGFFEAVLAFFHAGEVQP